MDLSTVKKIYFIGIGGIGMSATAGLAKEQGFEVLGSDAKEVYPPSRNVLEKHKIQVFLGFDRDNIRRNPADLYVVSAGEDESNPEVAEVQSQGGQLVSFPEVLRELSRNKTRIVVSGTHGKSTVSGWLGFALKNLDDSSFMVGAVLKNLDDNFYSGKGKYIVFEGDEYKSLFWDNTPKMHFYDADVLIVNNLELDHPDMFSDLSAVKAEFRKLVDNVPDTGVVIYNADSENVCDVIKHAKCKLVSFGKSSDADFRLLANLDNLNEVVISEKETNSREIFQPLLFGDFNYYNMTAVVASLRLLGFEYAEFKKHVQDFTGVKRRFDILLESPVTVVNDYAHHATAVLETLKATRQRYGQQKIWAVFEPHTFSRTAVTVTALETAFAPADQVLLAPIYGAREKENHTNVTSEDLLNRLKLHHRNVEMVASATEAKELLEKQVKVGDVVVVMAVGSFSLLAKDLEASFRSKA